jgi:hypothetical protein
MTTEYQAVYVGAGESEPIALFKHGDAAQQWRRQHYGDAGLVATATVHVPGNADVAAMLAPTADTTAAAPVVTDDLMRAQIRSDLTAERAKERIRREIEAELDAEEDGDEKAPNAQPVELREPAAPFAPPAVAPPADGPLTVVTEEQAAALRTAGYGDVAAIRQASDDDLLKVPTVGQAAVKKLRDATAES